MKILLIGDTHSAWYVLYEIIELENPDLIVHCGDWGTDVNDRIELRRLLNTVKRPVIGIYGNHDDVAGITKLGHKNFHWLSDFTPISLRGYTFAGVNGNIAGNARRPWNVTEETLLANFKVSSLKKGQVDFFVSHEAPKGSADILRSFDRDERGEYKWKKSVGWNSLRDILDLLEPRFWLCGHLHHQQLDRKGKTVIFNSGAGMTGEYVVLEPERTYKDPEWLSCLRKYKRDE